MPDLITLDDARSHLNIPASQRDDDVEMEGFISALTAVVEEITGPVLEQATVERHDGSSGVIVLRQCPVLSVTSLTDIAGVLVPVTAESVWTPASFGWLLDAPAGILRWMPQPGWSAAGPSLSAYTPLVVAYTVGLAAVPPNIRLGALEILRVNWQGSQEAYSPGLDTTGQYDAGGGGGRSVLGYFVPNRAMELLGPSRRGPRVG